MSKNNRRSYKPEDDSNRESGRGLGNNLSRESEQVKLINEISLSIESDFLDADNCLDLLSAKLMALFPNKVEIEFRQQNPMTPSLNYADEFKVGAFTVELDKIRLKAIWKKGNKIEYLIANRQSSTKTSTKELDFEEFKYELSKIVALQAKKNNILRNGIIALLAPNLN